MGSESITLIGTVIGSLVAIAAGVIGSFFCIKNTRGLAQGRFSIKFVVIAWLLISLYLALAFTVPVEYKPYIQIVYVFLLITVIVWGNRQLRAIHNSEQTETTD